MQVNVTAHLDRSGFPNASRHNNVSAALFGQLFDGFVKRLRTIGLAVRHCPILSDVDRRRGEFHFLYALDLNRQTLIIMVILALRIRRSTHTPDTQRRTQ